MYTFLKFIHVTSIILLVGGLHIMVILNVRIARMGNAALAGAFMQQGKFLATRIFLPMAFLTFITGIGMVQVAGYGYQRLWIQWGMGGLIVAVVVGNAGVGRMTGKLARQLVAGEIDEAGATAMRRKIARIAVLNLLLLLSIVYAMVFKPT